MILNKPPPPFSAPLNLNLDDFCVFDVGTIHRQERSNDESSMRRQFARNIQK